jgi:hypothetical protein
VNSALNQMGWVVGVGERVANQIEFIGCMERHFAGEESA